MRTRNLHTFEEQLILLDSMVTDLLAFFGDSKDYSRRVYTDWDAKDVLGHLVMWHESFARSLDDLCTKQKPNPLKGSLAALNEGGVEESRKYAVPQLLERMKIAQENILRNIGNNSIDLIPYRKGSRDYSRYEHVELVYRHIRGHLADLRKKY